MHVELSTIARRSRVISSDVYNSRSKHIHSDENPVVWHTDEFIANLIHGSLPTH